MSKIKPDAAKTNEITKIPQKSTIAVSEVSFDISKGNQQEKSYDEPPKSLRDKFELYHVSKDKAIVAVTKFYGVELGECVPKIDPDEDYDYNCMEACLNVELEPYDCSFAYNEDGERYVDHHTGNVIVSSTEKQIRELGFSSDWMVYEDKLEDIEPVNVYRARDIDELRSHTKEDWMRFKKRARKMEFSIPIYKSLDYMGEMSDDTGSEDSENDDSESEDSENDDSTRKHTGSDGKIGDDTVSKDSKDDEDKESLIYRNKRRLMRRRKRLGKRDTSTLTKDKENDPKKRKVLQ